MSMIMQYIYSSGKTILSTGQDINISYGKDATINIKELNEGANK